MTITDYDSRKPDFWARPIFTVQSVPASIDYYCRCLGFEVAWSACSPEPFIAELRRPGLELILQRDSGVPGSTSPAVLALELHVHLKLDVLHSEFVANGARIREAPWPVEWQRNGYQMQVEDLDGHLLLFWGDLP